MTAKPCSMQPQQDLHISEADDDSPGSEQVGERLLLALSLFLSQLKLRPEYSVQQRCRLSPNRRERRYDWRFLLSHVFFGSLENW